MALSASHGLLIVDKPPGLTSRAVVNRVQTWFPPRTRIGHTGTLDPLATGVLVLCVGKATRLAEYVERMDKTYRASLLLAARSDTDDADGRIEPVQVEQPPQRNDIEHGLQEFVGTIEQVPPSFSAAKVSGLRAYDLARRGDEVRLKARRVHIYDIDILDFVYPRLVIEIRCGKGTYIRSLARDLGERLGCGALVETLRRTRVGPFAVTEALGLDTDAATARSGLLPASAALSGLPRLTVNATDVARLRQGRSISIAEPSFLVGGDSASPEIAFFDPAGELLGVGSVDRDQRLLMPTKVLSSN
jgi:tRNA pseudouridine55 synthase